MASPISVNVGRTKSSQGSEAVAHSLSFGTARDSPLALVSCAKAPRSGGGGDVGCHASLASLHENHFPLHQKYPEKDGALSKHGSTKKKPQ